MTLGSKNRSVIIAAMKALSHRFDEQTALGVAHRLAPGDRSATFVIAASVTAATACGCEIVITRPVWPA
jgi:hypothetical protein